MATQIPAADTSVADPFGEVSIPLEEAICGESEVLSDGSPKGEETVAKRPISANGVEAIAISEIEAKPVLWLWPERVPRGALTVLAGDPGLGKSLLTCRLAAELSRGELGGRPATSLMLTAED